MNKFFGFRSSIKCFFFFFLINFWLLWVFIAASRLSLVTWAEWGLLSSLQCVAFSLRWLLLLQSMGSTVQGLLQLQHTESAVAALRLWSGGSVVSMHQLSGSQACGIFPGQESNPCFLQFLNTGPPGRACSDSIQAVSSLYLLKTEFNYTTWARCPFYLPAVDVSTGPVFL